MSRWLGERDVKRGATYDEHFRRLAESGVDVHGEAAYLDALLKSRSDQEEHAAHVLDAGCGTGRVAIELHRRGHRVVGVDNDEAMLAEARRHAGPTWQDDDLATLDLTQRFDLVVAAGNVVVFLEPGTEWQVIARFAAHLRPGGLLVSGWRTDRLSEADYTAWTHAAGLEPVARHATWDAEPWRDDADWCVAVDRLPEPSPHP